MSASIVWGRVADAHGLCRWTQNAAEVLPGGGVRASQTQTWATDAADCYADDHPAPLLVMWRHRTVIGHVTGLVRRDGCLDAVGEITADAGALAELVDALATEGLRWSSSTERRGRSGPLVIRELSLAPASAVASIGLPDVRFSTSNKDTPPTWVRDALQRSRRYVHHRDRGALRVFDDVPRWIDGSPIRSASGHNPREVLYAAPGRVVAVRREVG
jgi:hypothetical protein